MPHVSHRMPQPAGPSLEGPPQGDFQGKLLQGRSCSRSWITRATRAVGVAEDWDEEGKHVGDKRSGESAGQAWVLPQGGRAENGQSQPD